MDSQALLEQLASNGGSDVSAVLSEHADPRMRLLAKMWAERSVSSHVEPEPEEATGDQAQAYDDIIQKMRRTMRRLRRVAKAMHHELEDQRDINDALAAALGACPLCWGEDDDCRDCAGRGAPGHVMPDRELFERLIQPAARRFKHVQHDDAPAGTDEPTPPERNQA
jgi:hypothetical protein